MLAFRLPDALVEEIFSQPESQVAEPPAVPRLRPRPAVVASPSWACQQVSAPAALAVSTGCQPKRFVSFAVAALAWLLAAATGLYWSLFVNADWGWLVLKHLVSWQAYGLVRELRAPGGVPWKTVVGTSFTAAAGLLYVSRRILDCRCGRHAWFWPALVSGAILLSFVTSLAAVALVAWRVSV
jgi:hypothetical protein